MSNRLFQQAIRSAAPTSATTTVAAEASSPTNRVERQIYVPRGRREINESKSKEEEEARKKRDEERMKARKEREERAEQERKISQEVQEKRRQAFFGDDSPAEGSSNFTGRREDRWESSRGDHSPASNPPSSSRSRSPIPDFRDHIDDSRLVACCVVVSGFPSDMSERAKESELSKFLEHGALLKWLGQRDCVLIFMNEALARKALTFTTRSSRYQPIAFSESIYNDGQNLSSIRELHATLKPERTSSVANRLIGAALGVRVPRKQAPVKSSAPEVSNQTDNIPDAWDD